jgi:hypothetical protein
MTVAGSRKRRRKRPLGARLPLTVVDDDITSTLFTTHEPSPRSRPGQAEGEWVIDLRTSDAQPAPLPRRHANRRRDAVHQSD